jgi:hypothetical protein
VLCPPAGRTVDYGTVGAVVSGVELYVGPVVLVAPDDLDEVIRDFLGDAKHIAGFKSTTADIRCRLLTVIPRPCTETNVSARARAVIEGLKRIR